MERKREWVVWFRIQYEAYIEGAWDPGVGGRAVGSNTGRKWSVNWRPIPRFEAWWLSASLVRNKNPSWAITVRGDHAPLICVWHSIMVE
jgi:hypothetical protein